VNDALHLKTCVGDFVKALAATECAFTNEVLAAMASGGGVQVSVHPPCFDRLVFRTGDMDVRIQQHLSSFLEAFLEVCLVMQFVTRAL
jgi:hypothetical protein